MGSNLAILSGMVAGAVILQAARQLGGPLWTGALLLTGLSACGLLAALMIPRVLPRGPRGAWARPYGSGGRPSVPIACCG